MSDRSELQDRVEHPSLLVLWDVDHTLIENGGVSKATYALAFERLTGSAPRAQPTTDGRTDLQIMQALFAANGVNGQVVAESEVFAALAAAGADLVPELAGRGYPLPGAADAVSLLSQVPCIVQSLLTGNIRANAENKLQLIGAAARLLDLDVGGYGNDHIVRAELVAVAQRKAMKKYGYDFRRQSTVLVGDTTLDVRAGIDGGARVVGVATGVTSEEDLRAAGADSVLRDLVDTDQVVDVLRKVSGLPLVPI